MEEGEQCEGGKKGNRETRGTRGTGKKVEKDKQG